MRKRRPRKKLQMTELEAKLYRMIAERLNVLAPMRGIEMTERQMSQLSTDLAIMVARVLVTEKSTDYQGKR